MTAILTDALKKQILVDILNNVNDSAGAGNYYIGIGRSEDWDSADDAPTTLNSLREQRNFRLGLQSIKSAEDVSFVVPRNNWVSGATYSAYDDNQVGYPSNPYYVLTEDDRVYICLQQGRNTGGVSVASTVKPNNTTSASFKTADGYIWKFLYTLSATAKTKYLSSNFIPVKLQGLTDSNSVASEIQQELLQDSAIVGQIANITITNGGTGYTSTPTIGIVGNGDSATAVAVISGGSIVDIKLDSNGIGKINHGYGYDYANITITGGSGSGAIARANLSPKLGFAGDARDDMKSSSLMFNTKPAGTESGKFLIGQDFRQVALIKNPKVPSTDSDYTQASGLGLLKMTFSAVTTPFTADRTISGASSGAKAFVDTFDSDYLYYHQTEETGFTAFTNGEAISEDDGSGAGTADSAAVTLDINRLTGDILYIENRAAIDRSVEQTEDIKVIIQI